ncbi:eukaryotic translation initiation factor 4G-like [Dorcoceras hygrometricum]|uniref:Eukaryotic translation initiation factor 4G-like n=1 Tax=Dorcoceras hygrometricum TaxID=472368 RepID=A0A2Z7D6H1_9LAMI|nr:eukaryotic translation initiation factor 4G-like [Dorcoceras hygrometricum]
MQAKADQRSKHIQKTTKACKVRDTRTTLSVLYRTPFNGKKLVSNGLICTEAIYTRRIDDDDDVCIKKNREIDDETISIDRKKHKKVKQSTTMEKELIANCGRYRQSGPRPEPRLLRQPALEALTNSARTDSPRKTRPERFPAKRRRRWVAHGGGVSTCVSLHGSGIQLAVGPQPLRLRNHNSGLAQRIMVKRLATSPHDPLGITDSACKNQSVVVSVQYGPFNPYIPIRSTTIGKSRVAIDPIAMHTSWRSNSDIASVTSIGYSRMSASGESSTTMHRLLHASGSHPILTPHDPKSRCFVVKDSPLALVEIIVCQISSQSMLGIRIRPPIRQSGPRPDPRLLLQAALEALTRSARTDSPRKTRPEQIPAKLAAAAAAHGGGGGGVREREGGAASARTWAGPTGPGPNDDIYRCDFIVAPIADQIGPIDSVSKTECYDVKNNFSDHQTPNSKMTVLPLNRIKPRDTASRGPTTIVTPESQFRTYPTDHGPYCTLTMTDWFFQALSVIPRGSWGDVARRFTMIRWHMGQNKRNERESGSSVNVFIQI